MGYQLPLKKYHYFRDEGFNMDNNINIEYKSNICKRCGRKLKNPESMEVGFGKICYQKFMAESLLKPLFDVKQGEVNETEKTK
jgi:hypothetical protein